MYMLIILTLTISGCDIHGGHKKPPAAVAGVLDLSAWDFNSDSPVNLSGDWEISRQRFIDPRSAVEQKGAMIRVPAYWNGVKIDGAALQAEYINQLRKIIKS